MTNRLAKDVAMASAQVDDWRAEYMIDQAKRLEMRAADLMKQAQEYRDLAAKLQPSRRT